jgi:hypothetical protein
MATFNINAVDRRIQYTSTGQTAFNFSFQVNASSELQVYIDDTLKTETTHYSVSLNGDGTGTVTFGSATTAGEIITIIGDQPLSRTTVFQTGQANNPATLETEFDNVLIRQQQLKEITDRSIQLKVTTPRTVTGSGTSGPLEFPYSTTTANSGKVIRYNSAGTALELGPDTTSIDTLAAITTDLTTLAGISSNITAVAADATDIGVVAAANTNIGTVASNISNINSVAAVSSLITSDFVSDLNTLATTAIVEDLNILATSDIVSDLNQLATTDFVSDLNAIEAVKANVTTVANNLSGVNSFAERYRVGSSDPTSSLDEGDLFYNSTDNAVKFYNGTSWASIQAGLTDIVGDVTPQLGGNLDVNGNSIVSVSNGNIPITPNGSGKVIIDGLSYPTSDGTAGQAITTDGSGNLSFSNTSSAEVYGFVKSFTGSTINRTVTVVSVGGSNKYFIDGVQQDTLELLEGNTYIFTYPSGHPFKFSTTSDGSHNSGSEYTTGVTHNSSTQVTIVVATGAPTLYYYCSSHSGMGGQANTPVPRPNTLQVVTTNGGDDNIDAATYDSFDDVIFASTGFTFSINNGRLIATV